MYFSSLSLLPFPGYHQPAGIVFERDTHRCVRPSVGPSVKSPIYYLLGKDQDVTQRSLYLLLNYTFDLERLKVVVKDAKTPKSFLSATSPPMVGFTLSMEIPGADTPDMHRTADCQLVVVFAAAAKTL